MWGLQELLFLYNIPLPFSAKSKNQGSWRKDGEEGASDLYYHNQIKIFKISTTQKWEDHKNSGAPGSELSYFTNIMHLVLWSTEQSSEADTTVWLSLLQYKLEEIKNYAKSPSV